MELKDIFTYKDGVLYWKDSGRGRKKDLSAGVSRSAGYIMVYFNGAEVFAHRIIWEMFNGPIPDGFEIDHISRVPADNRIENLRLCTRSQNKMNQPKSSFKKTPTSTFKGVRVRKGRKKKFNARIRCNGRQIHLGNFYSETDAALAYNAAAKKYFGEFSFLNEVHNG